MPAASALHPSALRRPAPAAVHAQGQDSSSTGEGRAGSADTWADTASAPHRRAAEPVAPGCLRPPTPASPAAPAALSLPPASPDDLLPADVLARQAAGLAGASAGQLFNEAYVLLAALGPAARAQVLGAVGKLAGADPVCGAARRLHWLRVVQEHRHQGARQLAEAVATGQLAPLSPCSFQQVAEATGQRHVAGQAHLRGAIELAGRARGPEHLPVLLAVLKAPVGALKQWREDPFLHFLWAWLPRGLLDGALLGRLIRKLCLLKVDGRQRLVEVLGQWLGLSTEGCLKAKEQLWQAVADVCPGRLPKHLEAMAEEQIAGWLQKLEPAEATQAAALCLGMKGSLSRQMRSFFSLGPDRLGLGRLQALPVLAVLSGSPAAAGRARTRRWVHAVQRHLAEVTGSLGCAALALVAQAEGEQVEMVAGRLEALLDALGQAHTNLARHARQGLLEHLLQEWQQGASKDLLACLQVYLSCELRAERSTLSLSEQVSWLRALYNKMAAPPQPSVQWAPVAAATVQLACGWREQYAAVLDVLVASASARRPSAADLRQLVDFAQPFCCRLIAEDLAPHLQELIDLPVRQRSAFRASMQPLLESLQPAAMLGPLISYCLRGPQEDEMDYSSDEEQATAASQQQWAQRVTHCLRYHPNRLPDLENVMDSGRIRSTDQAILALERRFGRMEEATVQAHLDGLVEALKNLSSAPAFVARRAGKSEAEHALQLLKGPAQGSFTPLCWDDSPTQYRLPHLGPLPLRRLVAWVAEAIVALAVGQPQLGPLLTHSLLWALAQCVDEEGPRVVCAVGISQRVVSVLQGYDPEVSIDVATPQQLLCALSMQFDQEHPAPTQAAIADFHGRALIAARRHFGSDGRAIQTFSHHLAAYLADLDVAEAPPPPA